MSQQMMNINTVQHCYGQLVIGPPGAGKTTYCWKMSEHLKNIGRSVVFINLDPANDILLHKPDIDIRELVILEDVMEQNKLGPNGALLYCMEYLEKNIDWLLSKINPNMTQCYIFDMPGQVELYCHHNSINIILSELQKCHHMQLCVVHLIDSHHCSDAGKFISALMLSLSGMLKIGLPHINVLSKIDLLTKHTDKLQFGIDFYAEVLDLNYLLECLEADTFTSKYKKLNKALVSIIEDYSLVTFHLLNAFDNSSLVKIKNSVDKANGYVFKSNEGRHINSMLACAMGISDATDYTNIDK